MITKVYDIINSFKVSGSISSLPLRGAGGEVK